MANRIVSVHAGIYGMGIYAIMLPSSGFSVAHFTVDIHKAYRLCYSCILSNKLDDITTYNVRF